VLRTGALIEAAADGRSGVMRTFCTCSGRPEVPLAAPLQTHFDFDHPSPPLTRVSLAIQFVRDTHVQQVLSRVRRQGHACCLATVLQDCRRYAAACPCCAVLWSVERVNAGADIKAEPVTIPVSGTISVSGLMQRSRGARACLVLAHGAGAGMTHRFMATIAQDLAVRGITTLRFQFPYMERGGIRPGCAVAMPRDSPRGRAHGSQACTEACAGCRRQILRRSHDFASTGGVCAAWRSWLGIPGLSTACAESTVR